MNQPCGKVMTQSSFQKLSFAFLSVISFSVIAEPLKPWSTCSTKKCIAIFDVGSTGTRLVLYQYTKNENGSFTLKDIFQKKTNPALNDMPLDQKIINAYLDKFKFSDSETLNIPTYFYATAGMRFLSSQTQSEYYKTVASWFNSQSIFKAKEIRTITGKEEGVFGWLAVNQLLKDTHPQKALNFGLMDMGGGSNQITFPIDENKASNKSDVVQLNIDNQPITLFSKSFLGLGNSTAFKQFLNTKSCFSKNYKLPNASLATGNAGECHYNFIDYINNTHKVSQSIKPALKHSDATSWYVIGGLGYLVRDKALQFKDYHFTPSKLLSESQSAFCEKDWYKLNMSQKTDIYFYKNCFRASYFYSLLVHGYGFAPKAGLNFLNESVDSGWIKGAAIYNLHLIKNH